MKSSVIVRNFMHHRKVSLVAIIWFCLRLYAHWIWGWWVWCIKLLVSWILNFSGVIFIRGVSRNVHRFCFWWN